MPILEMNGQAVVTAEGKSVLEAALDAGIYIPHLCYHPDLPSVDDCRLCVVEIEGMEGLPTACTTPATDRMVVRTNTEKIAESRREAMKKILSGHPQDCGTCVKYGNCELQSLKQYFSSDDLEIDYHPRLFAVDTSNPLFIFDANKCVLCSRCVRACRDLRGVGILEIKESIRGRYVGTADGLSLAESGCRFCGACAEVCPSGAIMDKTELTEGKTRKKALVPCRFTCPAEIDVPRYISFIREKNYSAALEVIREKVPFPEVLGYVCTHPCEAACRRGFVNEPIAIRELKRFAATAGNSSDNGYRPSAPPTGKMVSVIGSGPAGLTAACYLNELGHRVTVFESLPEAGGMLRFGIPAYRLPREVLDQEISDIEKSGVEITTGTRVESIDTLLDSGFEAVLIATGTHRGLKLHIPGADNENVFVGTEFLRAANRKDQVALGEKVLVLGGGSVAFDCARVARRLGAGEVSLACLESRDTLPAAEEEVIQAEEEGIIMYPSRTFAAVLIENGAVTGVECLDVESVTFDEDKNPQIELREGSRHVLEAETVIFAIGQKPEIPEGFGIALTEKQLIALDPFTLSASRDGVFAAGDAVNGTSSVIHAIAEGRKSASAIDRYLGGSGEIDKQRAPSLNLENRLGKKDGFPCLPRIDTPHVPAEERLQSFCPVITDIGEEAAVIESERCLRCDIRLNITPVKFWANY